MSFVQRDPTKGWYGAMSLLVTEPTGAVADG